MIICFEFPGKTDQPFAIPLLAGMSARVFSVTIVCPLELIRTKMQSKKLSYYGKSNEPHRRHCKSTNKFPQVERCGRPKSHVSHPKKINRSICLLSAQMLFDRWKQLSPPKVRRGYGAASVQHYTVTCHSRASTGPSTNRWSHIMK